MELTYYGHSCFSMKTNGKSVLFDPFITGNPLATSVDINGIKADYMLLSHGHGDHIGDVVSIYQHTRAKIISTFEVITWLEKKGVEDGHPMNHGGKIALEFGTIKMVNAIHSSSMPDGSYGGNPAGFIVETDDKVFYFAGDTALHMDMKLIGEMYKLDFAILPIGDNFTMGIDDALLAAEFVKTNRIIGAHYDSFPYIRIDHEEALEKAKNKNKTLQLLKIGETILI